MSKKRILFLGETYRADAITWMNGLKEFGDFEIVTWELKSSSNGISRLKRILEFVKTLFFIKKIAKNLNPDMVIAERTTSYGFLAVISGIKPVAIAQQGITDLWPTNSPLKPFKRLIQNYAFKKANLIHAWGTVMAEHMKAENVNMQKVMIMPKGINLNQFEYKENTSNTIKAIVTRSLKPEYMHNIILEAFSILKTKNIPFELTIVGGGPLLVNTKQLAKTLNIETEVIFTGVIDNNVLPQYLQDSNLYISMPTTEGVSASLFEAMASGCYPIVTDLLGNRSWITNQENGILVPSENSIELAKAIEWSFNNIEIREKTIRQNRNFVEKNANYAINMKKIAATYHQLIVQQNSHS